MDIQIDLKQRIEKLGKKLNSNLEILTSLHATNVKAGKFDATEDENRRAGYKEVIEIVLLLGLYNDHFLDSGLQEKQKMYEMYLDSLDEYYREMEKNIGEILNKIADTK